MKISIITVTYNCADTILDCLSSVVEQSYPDIEHVVIDGASIDGTMEYLNCKAGTFSCLLSEPDSGIYEALNKGLDLVSGEIIGVLHSDDIFVDKEVLSRVSDAFKNSNVKAVYGDLEYVKSDDVSKSMRHWSAGKFLPSCLCKGWMPPHPTLFLRRSLYEKFGYFDTRYKIAADYDFILRVLTQLTPEQVGYIPEVLVKMRTGGMSNRSFKHLMLKSWEDYQIIQKHQIGGLGTLLRKNFSKVPQFFSKNNFSD